MYRKAQLLIVFILSFVTLSTAQEVNSSNLSLAKAMWFVSFNYGYQMSGIKDEDFVSSKEDLK